MAARPAAYHPLQEALRELGLEVGDVEDILHLVQDRIERSSNKRKGFSPMVRDRPTMLKLTPNTSSSSLVPVTLSSAASSSEDTLKYLIADEQAYLKKLDILVHSYLFPIKDDQSRLFKSKDGGAVINRLFCNIEEIFVVHRDLSGQLSEAGQRGGAGQIGPIFCRAIPKMHHYAAYISNFTKAVEFFQDAELAEKYKSLFAFLENVELSDEQAEGMGLQMLLACPLNRIPQYEFLLGLFLQSMSKFDPHYKSLLEAMTLLSDLQSDVTTSLLNVERLIPIQTAAAKIIGYTGKLEEGNRVFIKEGALTYTADKRDRTIYAFLFSDKMVLCENSTGLSVFGMARGRDAATYKFKEEIQLQHTTIDASMPAASGKLPFTVSSWDGANQTPYRFTAASEQERKDWVEAFANVSSSLDKTKLFGVELEKIVEREAASGGAQVPKFVVNCCNALNANALDTAGLYRVSGAAKQIHLLRDQVDRDQPIAFKEVDHHVLSGLLKLYFRELPRPLLSPTDQLFDKYLAALSASDSVAALRGLIRGLPPVYLATLGVLFSHLVKLASHSETNKMTPSNIAIVFGPNILRPSVSEDQESQVRSFGDICLIVEQLIVHFSEIFGSAPAPTFSAGSSFSSSPASSSAASSSSSSSSASSSASASSASQTSTTFVPVAEISIPATSAAARLAGPPAIPTRGPRTLTTLSEESPAELPRDRSSTEPPRPAFGRGGSTIRRPALASPGGAGAGAGRSSGPGAGTAAPSQTATPARGGSSIASNPFIVAQGGPGRGRGSVIR